MLTITLVFAAALISLIAPAVCLKLLLDRAWNPSAKAPREKSGVVEGISAAPISQYG